MSINQYKRLMAMSVTLMVLGTAMTSFVLWVAARNGLRPWVGWKRVHSHWSRVLFYRWTLMDPESRWTLLLTWWAVPVSTVVSFIFLGFGEDAVQGYRKVGAAMVRMIPSKVLSKRIGESRKGTVLAPMRPSCGLRFVLIQTLQPNRPHSNVALTDRLLNFQRIHRLRIERSRNYQGFNLSGRYIP